MMTLEEFQKREQEAERQRKIESTVAPFAGAVQLGVLAFIAYWVFKRLMGK